jgi:hypothetical protein
MTMTRLHWRGPSVTDIEHSAVDTGRATEISRRVIQGVEPFHEFHRYHQKAVTDAHDGRYAEAIVALGTAVELLLRRAVQWASSAADEDAPLEDRPRPLAFRNFVCDLLPTSIPLEVDLADSNNALGAWWATGYAARNDYVHEGKAPSEATVTAAFRASIALSEALREAFESRRATAALSHYLYLRERSI